MTDLLDRPNTHQMVIGHRVFRNEFPLLAALVQAVPAGDGRRARLLAAHTDDLVTLLRLHHGMEDAHLWPLLAERARPHTESIRRMESQHHEIEIHLDLIESLLPAWASDARPGERDELARTLLTAGRRLDEHLDDEEREVLPIVAEHLSADEWNGMMAYAHAGIRRRQMMTFFGAALEYATPAERADLLAQVPAPMRLLWRSVGWRRYRAKARRVRNGATSPASGADERRPLGQPLTLPVDVGDEAVASRSPRRGRVG